MEAAKSGQPLMEDSDDVVHLETWMQMKQPYHIFADDYAKMLVGRENRCLHVDVLRR